MDRVASGANDSICEVEASSAEAQRSATLRSPVFAGELFMALPFAGEALEDRPLDSAGDVPRVCEVARFAGDEGPMDSAGDVPRVCEVTRFAGDEGPLDSAGDVPRVCEGARFAGDEVRLRGCEVFPRGTSHVAGASDEIDLCAEDVILCSGRAQTFERVRSCEASRRVTIVKAAEDFTGEDL